MTGGYDEGWLVAQQQAMSAIAGTLDSLERSVNEQGPVDMLQAYAIALRAIKQVDMEKHTLEQFVSVLVADRTYHAVPIE